MQPTEQAQTTKNYSSHVTWRMNHHIERIEEQSHEIRLFGTDQQHNFDDCFDAVLIANGARSQLRPKAWVKVDQAYLWGAAWSIVPECLNLNPEILHQFYDRSKIMQAQTNRCYYLLFLLTWRWSVAIIILDYA